MKINEEIQKPGSLPVNLAWTGGWDSTFRMLQLILIDGRVVAPHYIVRAEQSTGQEIDAMARIRRVLFKRFPECRALLLPTRLVDVRALKVSDELMQECSRIREVQKLNEQYPLLASYCLQFNIPSLEVCINGDETVALSAIKATPLLSALWSPLTDLTKKETRELVDSRGWQSIMHETVFCRRPKNGQPCGVCGPCYDAVTTGLGYRLPLARRLIARGQVPLRRWYRRNKNTMNPRLKTFVLKFMKGRY